MVLNQFFSHFLQLNKKLISTGVRENNVRHMMYVLYYILHVFSLHCIDPRLFFKNLADPSLVEIIVNNKKNLNQKNPMKVSELSNYHIIKILSN